MFSVAGEKVNMYVSLFSSKEWDEGKERYRKVDTAKLIQMYF